MKRIQYLFFITFLIPLSGKSQQTVGGAPGKGLEMGTYSGGTITEIQTAPPPAKGSHYISDQWNIGNVFLYNKKKVEEYPLKYELDLDMLEIKTGDNIKVVDGYRIYQFSWFDSELSRSRTFVNAKDYEMDNVPLTGIMEILTSGDNYTLLAKYSTEIIPSTYVKALDIGEKSEKIVKNIVHLLYQNGELVEIEKSRKKLSRQFGKNSEKVHSYIKSEGLNCKEEGDLLKIVSFADEL